MKKVTLLSLVFCLAALWVILASSSNGRATAANQGNTGGPGETTTCGSCHSGGSYGTVSVLIQLFAAGTTNTVTAYVPGTAYDLRVTINHTSGTPVGHGFQLTAFKNTNTPLPDTYSNLGSNVKKKTVTAGAYNGRTYCEHNGVGSSNSFNMRWTAPAAGSGTVVFYAAGNCVNGNNNDTGDKSGNSSLSITEAVALTVSGTVTNVNCNGGSTGAVTLTVSGGTSPYTYVWSNGATSQNLSNVTAATYTVTVTDAASSTATASFTITQPAALSLTATPGTILCNGGTTSVTLNATGGTAPYTYGGSTTNVTAGSKNFTVTDSKGCTANTTINITQPNALQASTSSSLAAQCYGGSVDIVVNATGGTPPYSGTGTFSATAGAHTYTVTDANNCSSQFTVTVTQPSQLVATANNDTIPCSGGSAVINVSATGGTAPYTGTGTFNPATPGSYNYTVTDAHNCTANASALVSADNGFSAAGTITNINCHGVCNGAVAVTVTGGTAPFTYTWSNAQSTKDASGLCAGNYQQTISDAGNCTVVNSYIITEPAVLAVNLTTVDVLCHGGTGTITATATGGTSPYSFSGDGVKPAGTYTVNAIDNNGCTATASATITEPAALAVTTNTGNTTGTDGFAAASVSGGNAPYQYSWSNGGNTDSIGGLAPGTYAVTITDANGCTITAGNLVVTLVDGISENGLAQLAVYPNPANEQLYVQLPQQSNAVIAVLNLDGREVLSQTIQNEKQITLPLNTVAPGIYLLRVTAGEQRYALRFMKQ